MHLQQLPNSSDVQQLMLKNWTHDKQLSRWLKIHEDVLLCVWQVDHDAWAWRIYQTSLSEPATAITDSFTERKIAYKRNRRTRRRNTYTTRQGAQLACENWVGGMLMREREAT